jgi:hypothetical protein
LDLEKKQTEIERKNVEIKDLEKTILSKDYELTTARKETLMAKGLMTSRGILEWALKLCYEELEPSKKFVATNALKALASYNRTQSISTKTSMSTNSITEKVHLMFVNCGFNAPDDYTLLYSTLSTDIHGYPWSGESVMVYKSLLDRTHACVIEQIAKNLFGLNVIQQVLP